jgi:DNA-binding transcriptional regulator GbsR (MarR family)
MEDWKALRITLAREALKKRIQAENMQFRTISNNSENNARTRTAKQKHAQMLKDLAGPEEIPDADDSSVHKRFD